MKAVFIFLLFLASFHFANAQKSPVIFADGIYQLDTSFKSTPAHLNALLDSLEYTDLKVVTKVKDIPEIVKQFYRNINWREIFMADKDGNYNCCCDVDERLPDMQLVYFGYNDKMAVMSYNRGGFINSQNIMIFKIESKRVIDFWEGRFPYQEVSSKPKNKDVIVYVLRNYSDNN